MTAISSATSAASRPAMRHATAAVAAIAGSSQSSGHAVSISRSAIAGAANRAERTRACRQARHRSAATNASRSRRRFAAGCRSNQPWPASQSRSCTRRIASSVSANACAVPLQDCATSCSTISSHASPSRSAKLGWRVEDIAPVSANSVEFRLINRAEMRGFAGPIRSKLTKSCQVCGCGNGACIWSQGCV